MPRPNSVRTVGRFKADPSGVLRTAAGRIKWSITRSNSQLHKTAATAAKSVASTSPAKLNEAIMVRLLALRCVQGHFIIHFQTIEKRAFIKAVRGASCVGINTVWTGGRACLERSAIRGSVVRSEERIT
jgi:hypothetical protein